MQAAALNDRFGIPDAVRFEDTPGGLTRAVISTRAAEAELYLQGAHLTHWTPRAQRPVLFVSSKSLFVPGKAIRGGVPVIFPWFGPRHDGKPGPDHGFARTAEWEVENTALLDDGQVEIALVLLPDGESRRLGYSAFQVRHRVGIGKELFMDLEVRNDRDEPLMFEEALHTYFAVGDIRQASLTGLEGTEYIDKTDGFARKKLGSEPFRIAKETDQVHVNTQAACVIHDPVWKRQIVIEKTGSDSTVVWNPWIDKAAAMSDMDANGWTRMLCVETANAGENAVRIMPGQSHRLTASVAIK